MKRLSQNLLSKYSVKNGEIRPKENLKVKIDNSNIEIPEDAVWVLAHTSKEDRNLITSCINVLKHSFILNLKSKYGIKFKDYKWLKQPENPELWGYLLVTTEKGTVGDGEVHKDSLQKSMHSFPYTMLKKRAEDRAILLELGLYSQGLYSESEVTPEMVEEHNIPLPINKDQELKETILKISAYLKYNKETLLELISSITGQPKENIDLDSMSTDLLAKSVNRLTEIGKEEKALRKKLCIEVYKTDPTQSPDELKKLSSKELEKKLSFLKQKKSLLVRKEPYDYSPELPPDEITEAKREESLKKEID